jgi:hypothetical protein
VDTNDLDTGANDSCTSSNEKVSSQYTILESRMTDRFDLEQQILECWKVTDDIKLFVEQNSTPEEFAALSIYYTKRFEQLWNTFETMCHERQFNEPSPKKL